MKKKSLLFIIIMIAVWLCLGAAVLSYCLEIQELGSKQNEPGVYDMPEGQDPFTKELLAGEWEYYPGIHFISDNMEEAAPVYLQVPFNGDYLSENSPAQNEKNSYRLVVNNCEKFDFDGLIFTLPFLYTDYRVFFNGHERNFRMQNPYGYPIYNIIHTGTVEVVIETTGRGSSGLTAVPQMTSIRVAMLQADYTKAAMGAFLAALAVFVLVILLLSVVTGNIRTRNYIITSLPYIISFAFTMLWGTGVMDSVMTVMSLNLVKWIIFTCNLTGLALIIHMHRRSRPELFSKKLCICIYGMLTGCFVFRLAFSLLGIWKYVSWICVVVFLICYLFWFMRAWRLIKITGLDIYIMEIGVFALFAITAVSILNQYIMIPSLCNWAIPAGIIIYISMILVMVLLYERQTTQQAESALILEKDILKMETALFASRMNPHFIYNSLTTVQELCYTDPQKAASLIVRFSRYLRTNLDFLDNAELIPFSTELDFIQNYIYIQKERFADSMEYTERIGISDFMIPPFSVQPLIENAIKYGLRANNNQGVVSLATFSDNDHIYIEVVNDGPEFQESDLRENHSVYIIKKRLADLCCADLTITYNKETRQSCVRISIPRKSTPS